MDEVLSPEGKARALANLQPQPDNLAGTKHGLHRFLTRGIAPPCRFCVYKDDCEQFRKGDATCSVAEQHQAALTAQILALPGIEPQDVPVVNEYAKVATAIAIADCYLAHEGPFRNTKRGLDAQPILKTRLTLSATLVRLAGTLGLTPLARAKLKASSDVTRPAELVAQAIAKLQAEEAVHSAVDGEFAVTDDNEC